METIFKSFLGLFFMLSIVLLGTGLIRASIDARNADSFAASYASRIGNSNYAEDVIWACEQDASVRGYELDVDLMVPSDRLRATYGTLSLHYNYGIPILGISQEHIVKTEIY